MQLNEKLYTQKYQERRKSSARKIPFHWRQRWRYWIDRRIPSQRKILLHSKNLFIFPSQAGFGFLLLIAILLLVAINFENSAVYALVFLLAGIFVISILHTFINLAGLSLIGLDGEATFAGREAVFNYLLIAGKRSHYGVQLSWQNLRSERVDLQANDEKRVALRYRTGPRGYCIPGRLKIESHYPLGLIRCWTWVDLKQKILVYPSPDSSAGTPLFANQADASNTEDKLIVDNRTGSDDFYGLRDYAPGDSMRNIAWKNYAKTGALNTKQFVDYQDSRLWLDWEQTSGHTEKRLEQLCYWALRAEAGHADYGLIIPGCTLQPSRGSAHLTELLSCLATYQLPPKQAARTVAASNAAVNRATVSGGVDS